MCGKSAQTPVSPKEISTAYWQIAPAEQARLWDDLLKNSIAAVGFYEINMNLSGKTENELMSLFKQKYPDFSEQKIKVNFRQLWNFINLKPGDKIVTNKGQSLLLALGIVNLSKIFGEMLMLIEADKRGAEFAVPLTYGKGGTEYDQIRNT
jgi:hypothetical protein